MTLGEELLRCPKLVKRPMTLADMAAERCEQACDLFDAGMTRQDIAKRLGVDYKTVSGYLNKRGRGR